MHIIDLPFSPTLSLCGTCESVGSIKPLSPQPHIPIISTLPPPPPPPPSPYAWISYRRNCIFPLHPSTSFCLLSENSKKGGRRVPGQLQNTASQKGTVFSKATRRRRKSKRRQHETAADNSAKRRLSLIHI